MCAKFVHCAGIHTHDAYRMIHIPLAQRIIYVPSMHNRIEFVTDSQQRNTHHSHVHHPNTHLYDVHHSLQCTSLQFFKIRETRAQSGEKYPLPYCRIFHNIPKPNSILRPYGPQSLLLGSKNCTIKHTVEMKLRQVHDSVPNLILYTTIVSNIVKFTHEHNKIQQNKTKAIIQKQ